MPTRHQVRQVALQIIFARNFDSQQGPVNASFWDMLFETKNAKLDKVRTKALIHLTRDYADKFRVFLVRASSALETLAGIPEASPMRDSLNELMLKEQEFAIALRTYCSTRNLSQGKEEEVLRARSDSYASLLATNATLINIRNSCTAKTEDLPRFANVLLPLKKSISKLQDISMRVDGMAHPQEAANKAEFAPVSEAEQEISQIQSEAAQLVQGILSHLDELDQSIREKLENFSEDRLSSVDKAILRLAAYELKYRPTLPVPVIAKEAILLAEEFSGSDSPRFINGLIAGIASVCRP